MREGCTTCHNPHGSINRMMLTQPDNNLCFRCHAQVQRQSRNHLYRFHRSYGTPANRHLLVGRLPFSRPRFRRQSDFSLLKHPFKTKREPGSRQDEFTGKAGLRHCCLAATSVAATAQTNSVVAWEPKEVHPSCLTVMCGRFLNKAVCDVTARKSRKAVTASTSGPMRSKVGTTTRTTSYPAGAIRSKLIAYVAGLDKDIQMPPADHGQPLTPTQVATLRTWIDQGADWGTNRRAADPHLLHRACLQLDRCIGRQ